MVKKKDDVRVNERIRAKEVRLISADGNQLGIVPLREALDAAEKDGMDLVEVAPNSSPPVCRIMDYGKYKYQTSKKVQGGKKKGKAFQVKEIKLRPHTEEHDLGFKIRNLKKFLEKKARVKVSVIFRGREMAYMDAGVELLKRISEEVEDLGTVEQPPTREGWRLTMVLVPK
ncbi:MAG: translation initiation factor IF-3 [Deltaproteobacteria bacterium]|nr:translation initiation factor IF-3 [Deltaproteobacteria bacterium]MBW2136858.1 translation initiation factor IF-3 [Deltaproteobacteria bacterium]